MVQNQNAPGTRSEHAGAKTNTIGANDTTNVRFTSYFPITSKGFITCFRTVFPVRRPILLFR